MYMSIFDIAKWVITLQCPRLYGREAFVRYQLSADSCRKHDVDMICLGEYMNEPNTRNVLEKSYAEGMAAGRH